MASTINDHREKVLAALPGTVYHVMAKTGLGRAAAYHWLYKLRRDKQAHITSRKRGKGQPTPVWSAGAGKDAPLLPPLGAAVYKKRSYKKRQKENAPFKEARAESLARANETVKRGDPLTSWIAGALAKPIQQRGRA